MLGWSSLVEKFTPTQELESDEEGVAWDSDSHKESHKDPKRSRKVSVSLKTRCEGLHYVMIWY